MLPCQLNVLSFPDSREAERNENFARKLPKSGRLQSGSINFKNAPFGLILYSVTIGFALPSTAQIGEISVKRIRATSACEQQGEKLNLQLAWLAGEELVTVPRY